MPLRHQQQQQLNCSKAQQQEEGQARQQPWDLTAPTAAVTIVRVWQMSVRLQQGTQWQHFLPLQLHLQA